MLMREIRKVTDKPIKYVVYSHNHWDHISGGKIFKEVGAKFVSHENCTKHFNKRPNSAVVSPDITFSDKHVLTLGGKKLELQYFGKNHGDCVITMRLPEEKMIFIVDIVTPERVPFRTMPDFLPDEWIRSLYEIEKLDFDTVIPGHGPHSMPATAPRIVVQQQREYLEDLITAVKVEWDKGVHNPEKLRKTVKLPKYAKWRQYDAWLPMNIERIWGYYHMGW
jgi:glyoxylase-like metal-dependent hydrolase (beta-lactamase superfamily II)